MTFGKLLPNLTHSKNQYNANILLQRKLDLTVTLQQQEK